MEIPLWLTLSRSVYIAELPRRWHMPAYFGGHPHPTTYVAQPKDNTLQSLLIEAFKLLELRFADYDADGIQIITFQQLQQRLAMVGLTAKHAVSTCKRLAPSTVSRTQACFQNL